jgi:hypothetical protein
MDSEIKLLVNEYYQIQKHRIEMSNQIFALKKEEQEFEVLEKHYKELYKIEKAIDKDIKELIKDVPIYKTYLKDIKGIGHIFSAGLISQIDITKADHASSIWKFCGLAPDQKRVKGKKINWNPFLKALCFKIGESFIKSKGPYREIYDTSRAYYEKKFPKEVKVEGTKIVKYTKGHKYAMAKRRTVKLFLSELYAEWRKQSGLNVSEPFSHRIM